MILLFLNFFWGFEGATQKSYLVFQYLKMCDCMYKAGRMLAIARKGRYETVEGMW